MMLLTSLRNRLGQRLRRFRGDQDGAVLVEFALTFPVILLFFAAVVLFGHLFWTYQKAVEGVREATRYISRAAPIEACRDGLSPSNALIDKADAMIRNDFGGNSLFPVYVSMPADAVDLEYDCTENLVAGSTPYVGSYRTDPAPVAVLTVTLTIQLPLHEVFGLFGAVPSQITTTVRHSARIFGS